MHSTPAFINLSDLFDQLEHCEFVDRDGHKLDKNRAYVILKELFDRDVPTAKAASMMAYLTDD